MPLDSYSQVPNQVFRHRLYSHLLLNFSTKVAWICAISCVISIVALSIYTWFLKNQVQYRWIGCVCTLYISTAWTLLSRMNKLSWHAAYSEYVIEINYFYSDSIHSRSNLAISLIFGKFWSGSVWSLITF